MDLLQFTFTLEFRVSAVLKDHHVILEPRWMTSSHANLSSWRPWGNLGESPPIKEQADDFQVVRLHVYYSYLNVLGKRIWVPSGH